MIFANNNKKKEKYTIVIVVILCLSRRIRVVLMFNITLLLCTAECGIYCTEYILGNTCSVSETLEHNSVVPVYALIINAFISRDLHIAINRTCKVVERRTGADRPLGEAVCRSYRRAARRRIKGTPTRPVTRFGV